MQPIPFFVAIVLGLAALTYLLFPLYREPVKPKEIETSHVSEREQNARQALQEVEFDFQLGNVDEHEYRSLRTRYMGRALLEIKQRQQREQEIDAEIAEQLRLLKEAEEHA